MESDNYGVPGEHFPVTLPSSTSLVRNLFNLKEKESSEEDSVGIGWWRGEEKADWKGRGGVGMGWKRAARRAGPAVGSGEARRRTLCKRDNLGIEGGGMARALRPTTHRSHLRPADRARRRGSWSGKQLATNRYLSLLFCPDSCKIHYWERISTHSLFHTYVRLKQISWQSQEVTDSYQIARRLNSILFPNETNKQFQKISWPLDSTMTKQKMKEARQSR